MKPAGLKRDKFLTNMFPPASKEKLDSGVWRQFEISGEGNLTMWGGTNFDEVLLQSPLCKLSVHFSEDPAQSRTFVLSVANKTSAAQNPAIYCFVRDRSKWLAIFRRRGVTPLVGGPAGV